MNLRRFYKATGVCALIYAAASLLSYALWISTSGFVAVTSTPPSPDRLSGAIANLLFGIALQAQAGAARNIGRLFLAQVAGFLIAFGGFGAQQDVIGNTGILVQVLAATATYAALGMLLRRIETDETSQEKPQAGRSRAAGASA